MFQIVGAFDDDEIVHVEGEVNPVRDMEIIFEELRLKDEAYIQKNIEALERSTRGGDKQKKLELVSLQLNYMYN